MAGLFTKLADSLDYLDGRVKQHIEGQPDEQDLESLIDQRMKRKQRVDAAKDNAPFGSALNQALSASSPPPVDPGVSSGDSTQVATTSTADGDRVLLFETSSGAHSFVSTSETTTGSRSARPSVPVRLTNGGSPAPAEVAGRPSPIPAVLSDISPVAAASTKSLGSSAFYQPTGAESDPAATGTADALSRSSERSGFTGVVRRNSKSPSTERDPEELRLLVKHLQKEVKELNEENNEFERRLLGQEKELKAAAEAFEYANLKAAARESELLDEIKQVRQAKDLDRRQFNTAMGTKEKAVTEMESQLVGVKTELETYVQQVSSLRREMANMVSEKEILTRELDIALGNNERGVEGLRAELYAAQMTIDDMKAQHTGWMRQAQRREQELEATNAELTESIAAKQREMETLKASFHQMGDSSHSTDLEMHRLQQELRATQGSLELERQHVVSLQREVRALHLEISSTQAAWKEEKEGAEVRLQRALARSTDLEKQLVEAQKAALENKAPQKEEMELRMRSVSEQLVKKQEQLDSSICETYALSARLKSAEQRVRSLEDQLVEARTGSGGAEGLFDLEASVDGSPDSMGIRNRGSRANKRQPVLLRSISRLEPIAANPSVAKVVDAIDRFTVSMGHYLRAFPVARLCFITYFILLHLWAFFVLVFHTERMEEIHGDVGGSFTSRQGAIPAAANTAVGAGAT